MLLDVNQAIELLKEVPSQVSVMIISVTPIFELRGAIPVGIGVYKMGILETYFLAVIGNVIPVILLVFLFEIVANWLSEKFEFWKKFFDWLFERTRKKAGYKIEKYGDWGLFFLVAIPLPVTGGWTGALASFLFGINKIKAIGIIFCGILAAGLIVTLITIGAFSF
ncbi:MAG: small multi-drug export protein [Candidatus Moranbacteria bacterium]|nr:small multi-drug export protein [Candidatus Moranbacteria bacterium]